MKWFLVFVGGAFILGGMLAVWYVLTVGRVAYETVQDVEAYRVFADSPENASYVVAGREMRLVDGVWEHEGDGPSVAVSLAKPALQGDVNADGIEDVVVILRYEELSRVPVYYLAVALGTNEGYIGSEGYELGEGEPVLHLFHEVILVRAPSAGDEVLDEEAPLRGGEVRYFSYYGTGFTELGPFDETVHILSGNLTRTDEDGFLMRTCEGDAYAVSRESPSFVALEAVYLHRTRERGSGGVFAVLAGNTVTVHGVEAVHVVGMVSAPVDSVCDMGTTQTIYEFDTPESEETQVVEVIESTPLPL